VRALKALVQQHPDIRVLYPVHMNPNVRTTLNALPQNTDRIHLTARLHHVRQPAAALFSGADGFGDIQEEAPTFGKPVLVLRKLTEDQLPAQRCGSGSGHVRGRES
jgi:UDP-N-acetylglucosamine 2-epimerase (non-hydrolysing)